MANEQNLRPWKKGQSGNPKGCPPAKPNLRTYVRIFVSMSREEFKAVDEEGNDVTSKFFVFEAGALDGKKMGAIKEKQGAGEELTDAEAAAAAASIEGDRKTLRADAFIPAIMAVIFLLLIFYFKAKGGYRPLKIEED